MMPALKSARLMRIFVDGGNAPVTYLASFRVAIARDTRVTCQFRQGAFGSQNAAFAVTSFSVLKNSGA